MKAVPIFDLNPRHGFHTVVSLNKDGSSEFTTVMESSGKDAIEFLRRDVWPAIKKTGNVFLCVLPGIHGERRSAV